MIKKADLVLKIKEQEEQIRLQYIAIQRLRRELAQTSFNRRRKRIKKTICKKNNLQKNNNNI